MTDFGHGESVVIGFYTKAGIVWKGVWVCS
jgi:hypothetical protein